MPKRSPDQPGPKCHSGHPKCSNSLESLTATKASRGHCLPQIESIPSSTPIHPLLPFRLHLISGHPYPNTLPVLPGLFLVLYFHHSALSFPSSNMLFLLSPLVPSSSFLSHSLYDNDSHSYLFVFLTPLAQTSVPTSPLYTYKQVSLKPPVIYDQTGGSNLP